jgi:hypothetical protein
MDETAGELRRDLDEQRMRIGHTVDEIGNRVVPGRVFARRSSGVRRRITSVRERVMGHDGDGAGDDWYGTVSGPSYAAAAYDPSRSPAGSARERSMGTAGAPIPAGIMALSAGFLLGSLLPPSRRERELARRMEPELGAAVHEAKAAGTQVVADLREPAREAAETVKEAAVREARSATEEAKEAASRTPT